MKWARLVSTRWGRDRPELGQQATQSNRQRVDERQGNEIQPGIPREEARDPASARGRKEPKKWQRSEERLLSPGQAGKFRSGSWN